MLTANKMWDSVFTYLDLGNFKIVFLSSYIDWQLDHYTIFKLNKIKSSDPATDSVILMRIKTSFKSFANDILKRKHRIAEIAV